MFPRIGHVLLAGHPMIFGTHSKMLPIKLMCYLSPIKFIKRHPVKTKKVAKDQAIYSNRTILNLEIKKLSYWKIY